MKDTAKQSKEQETALKSQSAAHKAVEVANNPPKEIEIKYPAVEVV